MAPETTNPASAEPTTSYLERDMYSSLSVRNFRLFEQLDLKDLGKVNLFFGPNNAGKTSILEAVYTHATGLNFGPFLLTVPLGRQNGNVTGALDYGEQIKSIFRDTASFPYTCAISAKVKGDPSIHETTFSFSPSYQLADLDPRAFGQSAGTLPQSPPPEAQSYANPVQSLGQQPGAFVQAQHIHIGKWTGRLDEEELEADLYFPPAVTQQQLPFKLGTMNQILSHRDPNSNLQVIGTLKRYGVLTEFTEQMRSAFPQVGEIDIIPYPDGAQGPVYIALTDGQRLPLYAFGDGLRRWFLILGNLVVFKNAVHCIEEIDATFHPAAQRDLSRLLVKYTKQYNNQIFLTSHSIEFADNFLSALYGENGTVSADDEDPVRVFTVKPSGHAGHVEVWSLTGREAYDRRGSYELELR